MKHLFLLLVAATIVACGTRAKTIEERGAKLYAANNGPICLLAGAPPTDIKYEVLGRVVATKRSYGSSDELLAPMAREARRLGADAIINLQAGQRFKGPLPWRITSPSGDGTAIKVLEGAAKLDCAHAGGKTL